MKKRQVVRLTKAEQAVIAEARRLGFNVDLYDGWNEMTKTQRRDIMLLIKQLNVTGGVPPHRM